MATINIFDERWLNLVFAGKNKHYGAYDLRTRSAGYTTRAFFIATTLFVSAFFAPQALKLIRGTAGDGLPLKTEREVVIQPPPPVNPDAPKPQVITPPAARQDQIKFTPPIVKPDNQVRHDVTPPEVQDLRDKAPGGATVKGDADGEVLITQPTGTGPKQSTLTEETDPEKVYNFAALEVQPQYEGGMDKFYSYVKNSIRYPAAAEEAGVGGKVYLSFVVEKDGTLTDIKVLRGVGYGLDQEAVRVLKASKKWQPGVQNGIKVRSSFTQVITFAPAVE